MANNLLQIDVKGISYKLLSKNLENFERRLTQKVRAKMIEAMEFARGRIVVCTPKQTGMLREHIASLPISNVRSRGFKLFAGKGTLSVSLLLNRQKDKIILWVNYGTGIYGPRHRVIRPVRARVMVFEYKGQLIFAKTVRGQKGQHFIERGLNISKLIVAKKVASAFR